MKRTVTYLIMLFAILACSDEFTESPAIGALSDESLKNETGVDLMLVGAYSAIDGVRANEFGEGWSMSGDNWVMDVLSDDAHKGSTDGDQQELYNLETMTWATGSSYFYGKWGAIFAGINRANAVIALIETIEEGDFSSQLAEARFLRGHYNFELQKMWGKVPYISEENYAATEFNQPNTSDIWEQIETDFQFAIDNLPATQAQVGKPTSWTAKAFMGKAHLYQSDWDTAFTLLNEVVTSGPYDLLPDYVDNFRLAGDNSVESIFAIQFTTDDGQSYNANVKGALNFPNPGPFGSCCGFYSPTQDLLNAFQTNSGLPLLDTYNQTDVNSDFGIASSEDFTPFEGPLDPRADYTVGRRGIDYNGYGEHPGNDWIRAENSDISGTYLPKKNVYWVGETGNISTGSWGEQLSGVNYHIMRFADVLLMAAEAAVEKSSPDLDLALQYVNRVRARAKSSNYMKAVDDSGDDAANYEINLYTSFPNASYARKAVRFERRLELGMEGHRLFDLRRWGNYVQVMTEYAENEGRTIIPFGEEVKTYSDFHNLFPIPVTAIDLSGGILEQNSGY
ncbi:RagB/SusD family nutrient uptake outer membrane protein [Maribacter sp. ANRC-HE7]|uniref:RagB/SusD family nutrient uptake outer membrane protein n=1 Tax=Maribacter aquimaris TaxID=2737171 RepID=A0ABR7V545_9FLAO|nr:RagB/SusD family nutrient uptake outer membrane protein [Maribacter aquimaris]MBD0778801.1 RagB/SusD family nutrient uptake outer membrane protein [Maribacter aquimaris]